MIDPAERIRARNALLVMTSIWGSTFVVLQSSVDRMSPLVLVSTRFLLAAFVLAAIRPSAVRAAMPLIVRTLPLSFSMLAGFALQTSGLETTTPARSAFITSLSVILVPVLDMFDTKRLPRWRLAAATGIAGIGIFALFHPIEGEWVAGDTKTLIAAALFAWYIVDLGKQARRNGPAELAMAQFLSIGLAGAIAALFLETPRFDGSLPAYLALAYLGIVCTAFTFVLMTWAQARVNTVTAAIIYTLEPVIAAAFSVALGREPFRLQLAVGGTLVVVAMLVASTDPSEPHPVAPPEGFD